MSDASSPSSTHSPPGPSSASLPAPSGSEETVGLTMPQPQQSSAASGFVDAWPDNVEFVHFTSETQMPAIMDLIGVDLSEPYSVYTYRYFIHNWPKLCIMAKVEGAIAGVIVCKLELHKAARRGYIAMLAIAKAHRKRKMGTHLVRLAIQTMTNMGCDEVVLETEITNQAALNLYENLGFVRDKRLQCYYLSGRDAFRLKLWLS